MGPLQLLLPLAFFAIWLAVVVYLLSLATRLVQAVERIADRFDGGMRGPV